MQSKRDNAVYPNMESLEGTSDEKKETRGPNTSEIPHPIKLSKGQLRTILLISVLFGTLFWAMDSSVDALIFKEGNLYEQLLHPEPVEIWIRLIVLFLLISFGLVINFVSNKKIAAEDALLSANVKIEGERRFRAAFENAAVGASMVDLDGRFIKVNRRLCDMLGYSREELLQKTFSDVTHPDDIYIGLDYLKRQISGEIDYASFEKRYIHKDGHVINLIISPSLVRDEKGNPQYFVGLFQDITDRKKAEAGSVEVQETLQAILEATPYGILLVDKDKTVLHANKSALRLMGYEGMEEIVGRVCHETLCPAEANKCPILDLGQDLDRSEKVLVTKDGRHVPILKTVVPVMFLREEVLLEAFVDITERKEFEDRLSDSLKEKELLLKEIHHRVKNNLAIVSSLLRLQAKYANDEDLTRILTESRNRIMSMALVHEKLYQSGDFTRINLENYLQALINTVYGSYHVHKKHIKVIKDIDSNIPLDIDRLIPCGLIINELVTNALKHAFKGMKEGEIRIGLTMDETNTITLSVADNGRGLPEGLDVNESKSLGLQLVTSLAVQLRGRLVYEKDGRSRFVITFPC